MAFNNRFYFIFSTFAVFVAFLLIYSPVSPISYAAVCDAGCSQWVVEPCKNQSTSRSCIGGNARCTGNTIGTKYCRVCKAPCTSGGGGGGGGVAPTTAPVGTACKDSDGGSSPNVYGYVTISAPALPEVKYDTCMFLKVQTNGGSTTSQWIAQATGTHVAEKTCVNAATGSSADTILACPNGCSNGACTTTVVCNQACAAGYTCVNVVCPAGAQCIMGGPTCLPNTPIPPQCPKRPQGDANCDGVINAADYDVFKSKMIGLPYACPNCTADFNTDNKVDLFDYEIWRSSVYK